MRRSRSHDLRAWLRRLRESWRADGARPSPRGRHAAGPRHAAATATPATATATARPTFVDDRGNPWARPWTTPTPTHVHARHAPLRGEDIALVRPYVRLAVAEDDTLRLRALGRTA
ncbi:hypothetical protein [Streptomyces sp. NPDC049906]|uniref:hypothetical protein n=1 Tax=Streptomyces sp. NPDC049906 TaxID=3155656 RepID=UPI00343B723E